MPNTITNVSSKNEERDALKYVITNQGITNAQESAGNSGWNVQISRFSVSKFKGELNPDRTTDDMLETWFSGSGISNPERVSPTEVKFDLVIPSSVLPNGEQNLISEIYLFGRVNKQYLLPNGEIIGNVEDDERIDVQIWLDNLQDYLYKSSLTQYTTFSPRRKLEFLGNLVEGDWIAYPNSEWPEAWQINPKLLENVTDGTIFYVEELPSSSKGLNDFIINLPKADEVKKGMSFSLYNMSNTKISWNLGDGTLSPITIDFGGVITFIALEDGKWSYTYFFRERFNDYYMNIYNTREFLFAIIQPVNMLQVQGGLQLTIGVHLKFNYIDTDVIQFLYAAAQSIQDHNSDPFAHQDIRSKFMINEWVANPFYFSYVSPDTVKIKGNLLDIYKVGRRLKFGFKSNENQPNFKYSKIKSVIYDGDGNYTHVTVEDAVNPGTEEPFFNLELDMIYYSFITPPSSDYAFNQIEFLNSKNDSTVEIPTFSEEVDGSATLLVPDIQTYQTIKLSKLLNKQVPYINGSKQIAGTDLFTYDVALNKMSVGQVQSTVNDKPPFEVTSSQLVINLNSDLWDGKQFANYINQPVRTTDNVTHNNLKLTGKADVGTTLTVGGNTTLKNLSVSGSSTLKGTSIITSALMNNLVVSGNSILNTLTVNGNSTFSGTVSIRDILDTISFQSTSAKTIFKKNIEPEVNGSLSLGTDSLKFANIFATIFHGNLNGKATSAVLSDTASTANNVSVNGQNYWNPTVFMVSQGSTQLVMNSTSYFRLQYNNGTYYTANSNGHYFYGGSIYNPSSRELKTNIKDYLGSALEIINKTKIVEFNWKSDLENEEIKEPYTNIGFIAEDTDDILTGPTKKAMSYQNTIGLLFKAVQELTERLNKVESENIDFFLGDLVRTLKSQFDIQHTCIESNRLHITADDVESLIIPIHNWMNLKFTYDTECFDNTLVIYNIKRR